MKLDFFEIIIIILLFAKLGSFIDYEWYVLIVLYIVGAISNHLKVWFMDRRAIKASKRF